MAELYPPVGPDEHGLLDVGDSHTMYWEKCRCGGRRFAHEVVSAIDELREDQSDPGG